MGKLEDIENGDKMIMNYGSMTMLAWMHLYYDGRARSWYSVEFRRFTSKSIVLLKSRGCLSNCHDKFIHYASISINSPYEKLAYFIKSKPDKIIMLYITILVFKN